MIENEGPLLSYTVPEAEPEAGREAMVRSRSTHPVTEGFWWVPYRLTAGTTGERPH